MLKHGRPDDTEAVDSRFVPTALVQFQCLRKVSVAFRKGSLPGPQETLLECLSMSLEQQRRNTIATTRKRQQNIPRKCDTFLILDLLNAINILVAPFLRCRSEFFREESSERIFFFKFAKKDFYLLLPSYQFSVMLQRCVKAMTRCVLHRHNLPTLTWAVMFSRYHEFN